MRNYTDIILLATLTHFTIPVYYYDKNHLVWAAIYNTIIMI